MNVKESMLDTIGNTPLIKLNKIKKEFNLQGNIYAKLERCNPAGSIKDRIAKQMILDAIKKGKINSQTIVVEPTSGNTGIGICAILASLGIKTKIFMPSNMSIERIKMMRAFGADVVLTDSKGGMNQAIKEANEFVKTHENSFILEQFDNPNNLLAHYLTTGKEIYDDLDGKVDIFVAGFGTGGTISGVSKYLKEQNKNIYVVGVEPSSSPFISKGEKGPHKIQGIGAGFKPSILDLALVDKVETIINQEAFDYTRKLAQLEGLFCGISSGANLAQAIKEAAKSENKDKNIVTVFPDNGERYLSIEGLFE